MPVVGLGPFSRNCTSNMPDFTGYSSVIGLTHIYSDLTLLVSVLVSARVKRNDDISSFAWGLRP